MDTIQIPADAVTQKCAIFGPGKAPPEKIEEMKRTLSDDAAKNGLRQISDFLVTTENLVMSDDVATYITALYCPEKLLH